MRNKDLKIEVFHADFFFRQQIKSFIPKSTIVQKILGQHLSFKIKYNKMQKVNHVCGKF